MKAKGYAVEDIADITKLSIEDIEILWDSTIMTAADIRQHEAGALTFGRETYGDDFADAMYLGTFNSIHYFGPVFLRFQD